MGNLRVFFNYSCFSDLGLLSIFGCILIFRSPFSCRDSVFQSLLPTVAYQLPLHYLEALVNGQNGPVLDLDVFVYREPLHLYSLAQGIAQGEVFECVVIH